MPHPMRKRWIKLWTQETLYGTTSKELTLEEQAIWFKFLALAGDSSQPGIICAAPDIPYTDSQLARIVGATEDLLKAVKSKMEHYQKINQDPTGIHILNWQRYQETRTEYMRGYMEQRRIRGKPDIPMELRIKVWKRDGGHCLKCGTTEDLQADHIIAYLDNGPTNLDNLQTLCQKCNMAKMAQASRYRKGGLLPPLLDYRLSKQVSKPISKHNISKPISKQVEEEGRKRGKENPPLPLPFTKVKGFQDLKDEVSNLADKKGKIGFLINAFKFYHSHAPADDLENSNGRIAGILKSISYDYGYLLKLIWDSQSIDISGSHLNYIQGMIKGRNGVRLEDSGLYKEI